MALSVPLPALDFYQRLSARERTLTLLVGGTVFILANLFVLSLLLGSFGENRRLYDEKTQELRLQTIFAQEAPMWAQRVAWLKAKQPVLANRDRAGTELLDLVQGAARTNAIVITNPKIIPPPFVPAGGKETRNRDYQAVSVEVDTESGWGELVNFAQALQRPEAFVVFELVSLRSNPGDANRIGGKFRISKWYAPTSK